MKHIAIMDVGALSKSHLQSMVELQDQCSIYAVEINEEIIRVLSTEVPNVNFIKTVQESPNELEVVVIAINSNIRRILFEQLINHSFVKNIIFEKVLFPKEEDYYWVHDKLKELGIHAGVNCARIEWNSYKLLKEELTSCNELHISDAKTNWQWEKREFQQVYQSQMTGRVIKSIIDGETCNLSDYKSSMKLHLKYILPLIDFFKSNGMEEDICPIT